MLFMFPDNVTEWCCHFFFCFLLQGCVRVLTRGSLLSKWYELWASMRELWHRYMVQGRFSLLTNLPGTLWEHGTFTCPEDNAAAVTKQLKACILFTLTMVINKSMTVIVLSRLPPPPVHHSQLVHLLGEILALNQSVRLHYIMSFKGKFWCISKFTMVYIMIHIGDIYKFSLQKRHAVFYPSG